VKRTTVDLYGDHEFRIREIDLGQHPTVLIAHGVVGDPRPASAFQERSHALLCL
jgi:hypothetical protein